MKKRIIVETEMPVDEMIELFFKLAVELSFKFENKDMRKDFLNYYQKYFVEADE